MLKKGIVLSLVTCLSLIVLPTTGDAYQFMTDKKYKLSDPKDAYYWIDPAFSSTDRSYVDTGINAWDVTPEIQFTKKVSLPGGANIMIEKSNSDKGSVMGQAFGKGKILLYKGWTKLSASDKKETVVHEVGHELGLAHTQHKNDTKAVMRETNFNKKPYPLSDDKAGIAKKY